MKGKSYFRIAVFLLALNFLSENFGYLTHQLYLLFGILCLIFYGISIFPFGREPEKRSMLIAGYFLLAVSIFFFSGPILSRLVAAGIFLYSMGLLLKGKGSKEKEIPILLATSAIYFYFFLFYLYSPPFWHVMKKISFSFSHLAGKVVGAPILFSSTFLGLPVTLLFLIFILIIFSRSKKKSPSVLFLYIISLIFLSGLYLALIAGLPGFGKVLMDLFSDENNFIRLFLGFLFEKDYPINRHNYVMNAPLMLFILYLFPLFLVIRGGSIEDSAQKPERGKLKKTLAFLIITVLAVSALSIDIPGNPSVKNRVVLYNKGFLNWSAPNFNMFGSKSAGMFGNLPKFLESMGFTSENTDTISKEVLKEAKILMMINVDKEIPDDELKTVWNFVEDGGSLLVLGDHTFYKSNIKRIILNDILKPYSIRFNFDSADWFVGGWVNSYQYASHPVTSGMRDDMNDAGIVIGASIKTDPPAFPLVIGKYGYSDPGDDSEIAGKRGYLGNLDYDSGEPLGDVELCGAQHFGKGKVMVFGDTSAFANAILVNSYDFVNRVFTWLSKDESPKRYWLCLLISLALFIAAFYFYRGALKAPGLIVISLVLSLITVRACDYIKRHNAMKDLRGNIAYVDSSHGERFSPESWNDNAVMGLYLNLMRNNYLPFSLRKFENRKLEQAKMLVLIAPSEPFTKKEIRMINDFVNKGGTLFLTVGWEEKEASMPLMDTFGFSIEYLPLAQFISILPDGSQKVRFYEAWPVKSTGENTRVIAAYRQYPVMVEKRFGKGRVILIGDSSFFWNQNLEMEESNIPENINFLKWLLSSIKAETGGQS